MVDIMQTNEYREGSADSYALVISEILDEALNYEGFHLDHSFIGDELVYLSLDWTDSHGKKHYRTLWEKRD